MSSLDFNAADVAPSTGFELLPAGDYTAVITDSESKPTSKGTGTYLQFTFQVIEGEHANRKLWARINYTNPSAEAQKIGRAELSALCRAVGVLQPRDTAELHNRPITIKVGFEKRSDTGDMTNKIKGYAPAGGVSAPAPVAAPAASTPPWAKKSA